MKKNILIIIIIFVLAACGSETENADGQVDNEDVTSSYPEKNIDGIIMWGEGGATDIIGRTLAPIVEDEIGSSLVMQNKAGAAGAIATQYVYDQSADGYTLLFGAENPNLYQVLDISERSYQEDFVPVSIIANSFAGIIVKEDSPYENLEELVDAAKENPNELIFGTTGEGGLPSVVLAMLQNELKSEFRTVPYEGEGPVSTALLGGEVDVTSVTVSAAQEYVESGDFRMLAVVNDEPIDSLPDVPAITDAYPEIGKYLPWGPFQAVFAHKDTPTGVLEKLTEAFETAIETDEFKETLANLGMEYMNISGQEAIDFVDQNRSTSAWMLYEAGETEKSPEEFNIPKVEEE
ncbi:tripartite tricarboxylate transporter substrate binding protein [Virgibacillus sp. YIM 98842]|uniref:tripartite tricarboxylate transporter substrate binding protein n=1 Tax=Virgibacillus sp. YIM 98842 TaxID=2663533 RepID=UPI0013DA95DF|nr:tripartite tricarboxylate transporter substrate binding protein [Virgibacillus sp. YIM 98842]